MIRLYDTARREVVPLTLRDEGRVGIYVCGPTVYSAPHIGHGRMVLVFDILRRYLIWSGLDVTFVSNITDIDDKIIKRGREEGRDPAEIAVKCEKVWWEAMDRINVMRPDHTPRATEYVDGMVELIGRLVDAGRAYVTSDGVYLSVDGIEGYGVLANQSLDDLVEGGGERDIVGVEKRHPADFVLWKLAKEGEPEWPSPWGPGRPGWHTECVVMSLDLLGEGFDLHTGGLDLRFPHHENERAQAVADGRRFAGHWMHNGMVETDGVKMSKSLGNVSNLLDLTDNHDPRAYRLLLLQSHYRSPVEVSLDTIGSAEAALERLDALGRRAANLPTVGDGAADVEPDGEIMARFADAMDNDLDTPAAAELLFRQVREANTALDAGDSERGAVAAATVLAISSVFGLDIAGVGDVVPDDIVAMAEERQAARSARDFERADALRDKLLAAGWVVEDGADGPVIRPA